MEMKALDSDSEFGDNGDFNSNELNMEQEEDDFDDEHDGEEEEEESENEEELEKEYMNLRHQEQYILKKDLLKGQAVKNHKALWDKALEFRFLLQKAFSSSHGIMDYHR